MVPSRSWRPSRPRLSGSPFQILLIESDLPGMSGFNVAACVQEDPELSDCSVMVLTSAVKAGDALRYRRLGVARYLQKPVVQSDLLDSILQLTGHGPDQHSAVGSDKDSHFTRPLKVLLAEDGLVNQQVAIGLLTQRGHEVVVAKDGREALDAVDQDSFDLVLMDVQMPIMDGLEATRAIRAGEENSGQHLPIIAMTAGAMKGDEQRCLESGMDAYISKPIAPELLFETIERLVDDQPQPTKPEPIHVPTDLARWRHCKVALVHRNKQPSTSRVFVNSAVTQPLGCVFSRKRCLKKHRP